MFDTRLVRGWAKHVARNERLRDEELKKPQVSIRDYGYYNGCVDTGRYLMLSYFLVEIPGKDRKQLMLEVDKYVKQAHEELEREEKTGLGLTKKSA